MGPLDTKAYLSQAATLEHAGDLKQAAVAVQKALVLSPETNGIRQYLAKLLKLDGRPADAYAHYRKLWQDGRIDLDLQVNLVDTLRHQTDRAAEPGLEDEISLCLSFQNVAFNSLANVVAARLKQKYPSTETPDLDALCADDFLRLTLERIFFTDAELESLLKATRRALMIEVIETGTLSPARIDLSGAIALQGANNEYGHDSDDYEKQMLDGLMQMQEAMLNGEGDTDGLLGTVLVAAMYRPLIDMPAEPSLRDLPLENWPETVRPLVRRTLSNRRDEQEIAATIPALKPIEDETSQSVQAMYEENPYPRWLSMAYRAPVDFNADMRVCLPEIDLPDFSSRQTLDVLVAGCGTGRQPISVAKAYKSASVTALDLSRASLAYGKRMATEMDVDIDFLHGNILDLSHLDRRFPLIYCSGVLHHMEDPVAGWTVLCGMLEPEGLMNIGLYSERARAVIVKARLVVEKLGIGDDAGSIRRFRHDVMSGRYGDMLTPLTRINDFYSLSGCRDLIFHVQETRYTLPQIDAIRRDLGLEFMGFETMKPVVANAYRQSFPDDPAMTDLANWDLFEAKNPGLFLNMYNMWFRGAK